MGIDLRIEGVNYPAKYTFKESTYDCEIIELSETDFVITAKQVFYTGDVLKINVDLDEEAIEFIGKIAKVNPNASVLLEIEEIRPDDKDILSDFVLSTYKSHKIKSNKNPFR